MFMCLKVTNLNTNICDRKIFLIDDMLLIGMNIEYPIPQSSKFQSGGYGLLSVKCFFSCIHFCPIYGYVTLQCKNFTFVHGSDNDEVRGQSHEIIMCIPFTQHNYILYLLTCYSNMCPVYQLCCGAEFCIIFTMYTTCHMQVVVLLALPVLIFHIVALIGFPCCTHRLHVFHFFYCILLTCWLCCHAYEHITQ